MYDNNWNFEDEFNFTVYLECDTEDENSNCDYDEWFEDWDYVTEDTDDDNLDDTIIIDFYPNTECDCEMDVLVYLDVYQNSSGNFVDYENEEFTINRTDQVILIWIGLLITVHLMISLSTFMMMNGILRLILD